MKPSIVISALRYKNFSGSAKRDRLKVSLFHTATILMLVAFDGLTLPHCGPMGGFWQTVESDETYIGR